MLNEHRPRAHRRTAQTWYPNYMEELCFLLQISIFLPLLQFPIGGHAAPKRTGHLRTWLCPSASGGHWAVSLLHLMWSGRSGRSHDCGPANENEAWSLSSEIREAHAGPAGGSLRQLVALRPSLQVTTAEERQAGDTECGVTTLTARALRAQ